MQDMPPPPAIHHEYKEEIKTEHVVYKNKALKAMETLHGWCSDDKAEALMSFIWFMKPTTIVEIGVFGGKSLVPMAFALKSLGRGTVYGIDPWSSEASMEGMEGVNKDWWGSIDHEAILTDLQGHIKKHNLRRYVKLIQATSEAATPIDQIDILHIDGNHSEETSMIDVIKWVPLVRDGGMIIFDDLTWGTTTKATEWLDEHCERTHTVQDKENEWGIWIKNN